MSPEERCVLLQGLARRERLKQKAQAMSPEERRSFQGEWRDMSAQER